MPSPTRYPRPRLGCLAEPGRPIRLAQGAPPIAGALARSEAPAGVRRPARLLDAPRWRRLLPRAGGPPNAYRALRVACPRGGEIPAPVDPGSRLRLRQAAQRAAPAPRRAHGRDRLQPEPARAGVALPGRARRDHAGP